MSTRDSGRSRLIALLCTATSLGCSSAQVKPPQPEACPEDARQVMFRELKLTDGDEMNVVLDAQQPGDIFDLGTYHEGPLTSIVAEPPNRLGPRRPQPLPQGTLLRGRLWAGPGIYKEGLTQMEEAVIVRYTRATLPDGREVPVCITLDLDGRTPKAEGSTAEAVRLPRKRSAYPTWKWP